MLEQTWVPVLEKENPKAAVYENIRDKDAHPTLTKGSGATTTKTINKATGGGANG